METLEAIHKRASLKLHLSPQKIEDDKINKIIESARVAPSARNMQPWRFIIAKDRKLIENLVNNAFSEVNRVAKNASIIIAVCANPKDDIIMNGKEYYMFDLGLAVENMILAATDMGLATHIMAGIDEDELKKMLSIPKEVRCPVIVAVAHTAEESYDEAALTKLTERTRKNINEIVYIDKWKNIK